MSNEILKGQNTGKTKYSIDGKFQVRNVPNGIPENLFSEIGEFLSHGGEISNFDNDRNIIHGLYMDYILIEYKEGGIRDSDILHNDKIEVINFAKSKIIGEGNQIAENVGEFEYNGKYYLVVYPYNSLTDENNPNSGIYKGVIVNPGKYFEVDDETKKFKNKVRKIFAS